MNAHHTSARSHRPLGARFMLVITAFAAVSAWLLSAVAHLSDTAILVTVMAAAFTASWIATGARAVPRHRVTLVPVRTPARTR